MAFGTLRRWPCPFNEVLVVSKESDPASAWPRKVAQERNRVAREREKTRAPLGCAVFVRVLSIPKVTVGAPRYSLSIVADE